MPQPVRSLFLVFILRQQRVEGERLPRDERRQPGHRRVTEDGLVLGVVVLRGMRIEERHDLLRSHRLPELQFLGEPFSLLPVESVHLAGRQVYDGDVVDLYPDAQPLERRRGARGAFAAHTLDPLAVLAVDLPLPGLVLAVRDHPVLRARLALVEDYPVADSLAELLGELRMVFALAVPDGFELSHAVVPEMPVADNPLSLQNLPIDELPVRQSGLVELVHPALVVKPLLAASSGLVDHQQDARELLQRYRLVYRHRPQPPGLVRGVLAVLRQQVVRTDDAGFPESLYELLPAELVAPPHTPYRTRLLALLHRIGGLASVVGHLLGGGERGHPDSGRRDGESLTGLGRPLRQRPADGGKTDVYAENRFQNKILTLQTKCHLGITIRIIPL